MAYTFGGLTFRRLAVLCTALLLFLTACEQAASGGAQEGVTVSAHEESIFASNEIVVVRAYFEDEGTARSLATTFEPIESKYEKGYLLLSLSSTEFADLRAKGADLGVRVELDEAATQEQTRLLNSLNQAERGELSVQTIPGYPCYRTVEETFSTARSIAQNYPNLATWTDRGNSWDKTVGQGGYDIQVLKLTNRNTGGDKPKAFITSAIHAREYTTAELMTRVAEYLVENYGSDPDVTWILDTSEVHLMLQTNPDGRKIAEGGVLWRKNVNENYCDGSGADLNRNFDFEWNTGGSSGNQCSQTYRGVSAGSEPETQAVQNYLQANFPDRRGPDPDDAAPADTQGLYIDVHSSGKLLLWPWGSRSSAAPNGSQLQTLGRKLAFFNDHTPQQSIGLYPTSGTTTSYAYGQLGLASFTYELGTQFFEQCSYFENTILPDNLNSLLYALKVVRTPYQLPAGPDATGFNVSVSGSTATLTATLDDGRYNNSNGTEGTQTIAAARYSIDTPPWESGASLQSMSASDGSFNARREGARASIDTSSLSEGQHTVYVQGRDAQGNWGAVSAVFLDADGVTPPPPPPPTGERYTGTLTGTRDRDYQPDGSWYRSDSSGEHKGVLEGPTSANFDLYLYKWNSGARRWEIQARSTSTTSSEEISYNGTPGYYLWLVYSRSGSGNYAFTLNRP